MAEAIVFNYYQFFDKKIENSTLIVIMIAFCILLVGFITPGSGKYAQANLFDSPSSVSQIEGEMILHY